MRHPAPASRLPLPWLPTRCAAAREAAPATDAVTLQTHVQRPGCIGTVVPPVTALMDASAKAEKGQLPAPEAAGLGDTAGIAVTAALTHSTAPNHSRGSLVLIRG
ncbi:hypothetical protein [Streptomyces sp. NPDC002788]